MPVSPTYPGVYVEEIPSGVRTITGVATSITAFIGRAKRGPVNAPTTVFGFGEFERAFGGLALDSPMTYAVYDFFVNGGGQALIVRLHKTPANGTEAATIGVDGLQFAAAHAGAWGNKLRIRVEGLDPATTDEDLPSWVKAFGLTKDNLFHLLLHDLDAGVTETYQNVTVKDSPRRINNVLANSSALMHVTGDPGEDTPAAHPDPNAGTDIWDIETNPAASSGVSDGNKASEGQALATEDLLGSRDDKTGIYALENADQFNLLCIPNDQPAGDTPNQVFQTALSYCVERRAMLIVDSPISWRTASAAKTGLAGLGLSGTDARNAALYFPRVLKSDPLRNGQTGTFVPCGIVAGRMASTDIQRGVWKAPAGVDVAVSGAQGLDVDLTDDENGLLNPLGVNCLRSFPIIGRVVWGARTLRGADVLADEYKYVPVRRLALYLEESLYRGLKWVVFEPNDEPLWAQIRLNVGAFMHSLFRQGAFQGQSPRDAYFVKCDSETTTQDDINRGIVNVVVGFAPLKPAEFVILKLQQMAGQSQA